MINLRAHHLMCMQAYVGKGYSKGFEKNMSSVINNLEKNKEQVINLVDRNDDICFKCPNNNGNSKCIYNEKVLSIDSKVLKYLDLKPGKYKYSFLLKRLKEKLDRKKFQDICSECDWYELEICSNIFSKKGLI